MMRSFECLNMYLSRTQKFPGDLTCRHCTINNHYLMSWGMYFSIVEDLILVSTYHIFLCLFIDLSKYKKTKEKEKIIQPEIILKNNAIRQLIWYRLVSDFTTWDQNMPPSTLHFLFYDASCHQLSLACSMTFFFFGEFPWLSFPYKWTAQRRRN